MTADSLIGILFSNCTPWFVHSIKRLHHVLERCLSYIAPDTGRRNRVIQQWYDPHFLVGCQSKAEQLHIIRR